MPIKIERQIEYTEAIILAGGFGTRLKEVVTDLPKPMAPVNGTPFLNFLSPSVLFKYLLKLFVCGLITKFLSCN